VKCSGANRRSGDVACEPDRSQFNLASVLRATQRLDADHQLFENTCCDYPEFAQFPQFPQLLQFAQFPQLFQALAQLPQFPHWAAINRMSSGGTA
jgi:hypothetical protein